MANESAKKRLRENAAKLTWLRLSALGCAVRQQRRCVRGVRQLPVLLTRALTAGAPGAAPGAAQCQLAAQGCVHSERRRQRGGVRFLARGGSAHLRSVGRAAGRWGRPEKGPVRQCHRRNASHGWHSRPHVLVGLGLALGVAGASLGHAVAVGQPVGAVPERTGRRRRGSRAFGGAEGAQGAGCESEEAKKVKERDEVILSTFLLLQACKKRVVLTRTTWCLR